MKAVLAYVSPKKPKHIHNLSELFKHAVGRDIRQSGKRSQCAKPI